MLGKTVDEGRALNNKQRVIKALDLINKECILDSPDWINELC